MVCANVCENNRDTSPTVFSTHGLSRGRAARRDLVPAGAEMKPFSPRPILLHAKGGSRADCHQPSPLGGSETGKAGHFATRWCRPAAVERLIGGIFQTARPHDPLAFETDSGGRRAAGQGCRNWPRLPGRWWGFANRPIAARWLVRNRRLSSGQIPATITVCSTHPTDCRGRGKSNPRNTNEHGSTRIRGD
jgi:hypothetical protein